MEQAETWKPIVGFEKTYSVSNLGRIRRDAPGMGTRPGRILKPSAWRPKIDRYYVSLCDAPRNVITSVPRIVAGAFLGPCPEELEINHKDGDPSNNRLDNLEYLTPSDNMRHAFAIGIRSNRGEKNSQTKLTNDNVRQIRKLAKEGNLTHRKIGEIFGIARRTVSHIKCQTSWSHLK